MSEPFFKRRWLRYSMRTMLVLFAVVAVWLAVLTNRVRRQQAAIEALREVSAGITFDYEERGRYRPDASPWLRWLLGDQYFEDVVQVTLRSTRADDAAIAHLKYLPELRKLDLGGTRVTDDGLRSIGKLRRLKSLGISYTGIGDSGLAHLAGLDELEHLDVSSTKVSDEGLKHLAGLPNLRRLKLVNQEITNAGLVQLTVITQLQELFITGSDTRFTAAGVLELESKIPSLTVRWGGDMPGSEDDVMRTRWVRTQAPENQSFMRIQLSRDRARTPR